MKLRILIILLFSLCLNSAGQNYTEYIKELEQALDHKSEYIIQREDLIQTIKEELELYKSKNDLCKQILTCLDLVYEYQSFIYDSAYFYVSQAKNIALHQDDKFLINQIKVREGFVLLSSGLFKEAIDSLLSIEAKYLSDSLRSIRYATLARAYFDLADYERDPVFMPTYISLGNNYLDSAKLFVSPGTNEYWAIESLYRMKMSDWDGAKIAFEYWMENFELPRHYYGIATSSLGYINLMLGFPDLAIEYFAMAAVADVKTATMETVALRNLANLLYQNGEGKKAYRFIIEALNDASFYNARHRQLETGLILPIIEGERMEVISNQRDRILKFSIFISILVTALLIALIIIWIFLRRLNNARRIIQESNDQLFEANKIKDEYIANFFRQDSEYIEKIDKLQKWVRRHVAAKQFEVLRKFSHDINVDEEREALYERFDRIFLKLFPNFVEEFNSLLEENERIEIEEGQLLNTDLRIYALIRLGITDNERIARFLNYSINTIYTYKTKIKTKAKCESDQFTKKIMEIKSI